MLETIGKLGLDEVSKEKILGKNAIELLRLS
jgi:predicted TIM-barrel fold metal-dependent hydrolase